MKLSEAIRLGAMMKPQCFNGMTNPDQTESCAVGAAYDAIGLLGRLRPGLDRVNIKELVAEAAPHWIPIIDAPSACPACGYGMKWLAIAHINDKHRWTRERIADWVETIENAQVALEPQELEAAK